MIVLDSLLTISLTGACTDGGGGGAHAWGGGPVAIGLSLVNVL